MIQLIIIDLICAIFLTAGGSHGIDPVDRIQPGTACTECHSNMVEYGVMHYPAGDACDNCHESTGASHPHADSMGFTLMDRIPALCYYCHEEPEAPDHGHEPFGKGDCMSCHDAHGSSEPALLKLPEQELCLSCHNREYATDSSVTANIRRLIMGEKVVHSAIPGGGCIVCHQSHGSDYRELLVDQYPAGDYVPATTENFGLCFLCHDTDLLDAEETEWATGFRDSTRNLHRLHINGEKGRNCRMCHNLHGSSQQFLMEETVEFGNWEMNLNFIPGEEGGSCLPGCHGQLSYRR